LRTREEHRERVTVRMDLLGIVKVRW
jgi:hypothetical protein